jgi:hypothetical protein
VEYNKSIKKPRGGIANPTCDAKLFLLQGLGTCSSCGLRHSSPESWFDLQLRSVFCSNILLEQSLLFYPIALLLHAFFFSGIIFICLSTVCLLDVKLQEGRSFHCVDQDIPSSYVCVSWVFVACWIKEWMNEQMNEWMQSDTWKLPGGDGNVTEQLRTWIAQTQQSRNSR